MDISRKINILKKIFLYLKLLWEHAVFYSYPTLPEDYYLRLGHTYIQLGNFQKALLSLEKSEETLSGSDRPSSRYKYHALGVCYYNLGKFDKAVDAYKQALKFISKNANLHYSLGIAYLMLNELDSALKEVEILKELDTNSANKLSQLIKE